MTEIHRLSALDLADAMRRREISPVEVVEHYLTRIESWDARVGAFVTVTAERARVAALDAEQRILDTDTPAELPSLLGVPIGIKDLHAEAGVPMKLGSLAYADFLPDWDDDVVVALRHAGTISLGKTNTPELGLPCYTEPDPRIAPPARTPYDLTRSAGGSSGGAAAAVAAGLVAFAPGSDGGGSIRIPASACGLVGLKTTRGLVSNGPRRAEGPGLAVQGPIARTVADAAALLDAMVSGPGAGATPTSTTSYAENARRDPGRLRIGRCIDNIHDAPVDPACREAWERASAQLAALGHDIEDVPVPPLAVHYPRFIEVWSVGAASAPIEPGREDLLLPMTRWLRELGRGVSGVTYATAIATIQVAVRDHLAATSGYDVVLTPTLAQLPALVGSQRDDADPAADFDAQGRFTPFTAIYNLTGQPALSMPLHRTVEGLPVGVQLVGRPGADATLLALGGQLESTLDASTRIHGGVPIP